MNQIIGGSCPGCGARGLEGHPSYCETEKQRLRVAAAKEYADGEQPTLRDRFAMAALTGMLARTKNERPEDNEVAAFIAYLYADAMLEARKPKALNNAGTSAGEQR